MRRIIASLCIIVTTTAVAFAFDAQNFTSTESLTSTTSTWTNNRGSQMTITVDDDGNVTGNYINGATGTLCQGTAYPIVGKIDGNNIGFVVAWNNSTENCNSVTSWGGYGQTSGSKIQIVTNWNLAYQDGTSGSISQGSDTFTYQPTQQSSTFLEN